MERVQFVVEGSQGDAYDVVISRDGTNVNALCSCKAGQNGLWCRHRVALLNGEADALIEGEEADLARVAGWLPGSDLGRALAEVNAAQAVYDVAKATLDRAKKALSRAMLT